MMTSQKRKLEDCDEPPTKKQKRTDNPYTEDNNEDIKEWWNKSNIINNSNDADSAKNELIDYFANIDYMISNQSFENEEHEQMFIKNIIKEMETFDDPVFIFDHPDISKVMEKIIQIFPSLQIREFISKFITPNLYELISKRCSSHVLQTLFCLIPRILIEEQNSDVTNTDENYHSMNHLLTEIMNKLQEFESDNHGLSQLFVDERSTFVIRDLLWISSGVVRFNKNAKKHRMKLHNIRKIPSLPKFSLDHIPSSVTVFASHLAKDLLKYRDKYTLSTHIKHHSFKRNKHSNILCGSLQVLIECLFITKSNDILQELIDEIFKPPPKKERKNKSEIETDEQRIKKHIHELIMNESSSHLMQTMFEFGNKNVSLHIVKEYLNAKEIRDIALDKNGNYVLQSMLRRLFDVKSIQFIASSIQHNIVQLFCENRIGVLYCLIDAFCRANLKPNAMVKTILEEIKKEKHKGNDIIHKFLYLNLDDAAVEKNLIRSKIMTLASEYSVMGCLLLQSIIKCKSNLSLSVSKSFLSLDRDEIIRMSKDSSGSHCIQAFIECEYIYDDIKWQFLCKIEDRLHVLCTDKFGNYIMESTFFALRFPYKQQFAETLLRSAAILKGSKIGFRLYIKMKLDLFKNDQNKWKQKILKQRKHKKSDYKARKKVKSVKWDKKSVKSAKKKKQNLKKQNLKKQKHKIQNKKIKNKVKKSNKLF